jgi:uncharacterized protein YxjI
MAIQYPLSLNFKLIALAPRIFVRDASGQTLFYVHQKTLALKEHIKVYSSEDKQQQLFEIKADRMLDFSARYHFTDMAGRELGSIKHKGMRSIWKSTYEIYNPGEDQPTYSMTEDNPWVKVIDAVVGEIPFLGMFTGYFFNPTYTVTHIATAAPILRLKKESAFFESSFTIERADDRLQGEHETRLLLGVLMAVQLERSRG